jgi:uncharacterized protein (TIGR03437 family)
VLFFQARYSLLESIDMLATRTISLCLVLLRTIFAAEPPAIRRQGVVNSASQWPMAVGGVIARGSLVSIYGIRFAAGIPANRVTIETGGRLVSLTVVHAEPQRLDAWIPPDAALGAGRLTVTSSGLKSASEPITILKTGAGLFSSNGLGWGPARSENAPGNSVAPGGRIVLEATGLVPAEPPEIRVGNTVARVLSVRAARAPNYIAKVAVQVPIDAPEGCYVPVYARFHGAPTSNTVTVSVHKGGGSCIGAPDNPASGWQGGKTAVLLLSRTVRRTLEVPQERIDDELNAAFLDVPADKAQASPLLLLPPRGSCATYAGTLDASTPAGASVWTLLFGSIRGDSLNAGASLALRNQSVQLRVPMVSGAAGFYRRKLSPDSNRGSFLRRLTLDSGRLVIAGSGGAQVGPFAAAMGEVHVFTVSNPPPDPIVRPRDVLVEWSASNAEATMAVMVYGADANLNVAGLTYCNAPIAAGRFTIPAELLTNLPAGQSELVMATWVGRAVNPAPSGIGRMMTLTVYTRASQVRIE